MVDGYEADRIIQAETYGTAGSVERENYKYVERETEKKFRDYLKKTYGSKLSREVDAQVYSQAWKQGHENGYASVQNEYQSLADFAVRILFWELTTIRNSYNL